MSNFKFYMAAVMSALLSFSATAYDAKPYPKDFGVTDLGYRVAEGDFNIKKLLAENGNTLNVFKHQREVSMVENQQVIRENQDVLYSKAVVG